MSQQDGCVLSTPDRYKVCVGFCEKRCERLAHKEERNNLLREYERLVDEYNLADMKFEELQRQASEELFHELWVDLEHKERRMRTFREKHNITSQDMKELHNVKVATSVADVLKIWEKRV